MELVVKENIVLEERRISLSEFHTADEVSLSLYLFCSSWSNSDLQAANAVMCSNYPLPPFICRVFQVWTTGTMGELSPVS